MGMFVSKDFPVLMDYRRSLTEMIAAANFRDCDDSIAEAQFHVEGEGRMWLTMNLVDFDRHLTTEEVLRKLKSHQFKLARLEHLLAFYKNWPGSTRPEVVALGSSATGFFGKPVFPAVQNFGFIGASLACVRESPHGFWRDGCSEFWDPGTYFLIYRRTR